MTLYIQKSFTVFHFFGAQEGYQCPVYYIEELPSDLTSWKSIHFVLWK